MSDPKQGKPADMLAKSSKAAPVELSEQALDQASGGAALPNGIKLDTAVKLDAPVVSTELLPAVQKG
jgi:hypothetical protein